MNYFIKNVLYYATIAIALSLYSHSLSALQTQVQTQESLLDSGAHEGRRAYSVYHSGKLQPFSELSEKATSSSQKFIPMSERIETLSEKIINLTLDMDARSEKIDAISESIASIVKNAQKIKKEQEERLARKTSSKFTPKQTNALNNDEVALAKLASQKALLEKEKEKLVAEQAKDGQERMTAHDSLVIAQVSEKMGSFSYLNKAPEQSATWKQLLGAVPEGILSFGATFLNSMPDVFGALGSFATKENEKLEKEGVASYASHVAKETFEAIKSDPLSMIILPGSLALVYGNLSEVVQFSTYMAVGTANGLKNSQMLFNMAEAIHDDDSASKFVKYMVMGGAAYYALTSIPGTDAAVINYASQFLINPTSTALTATASSGNTISVVFGNSTHTIQEFYDKTTGAHLAGPFVLNVNPTATSSHPTTGFIDSTTSLSAWVSSGNQIEACLSNTTGRIGSVVTLNQVLTGIHGDPSFAPMTVADRFFMAWHAHTGTHYDIKFGTFNVSSLASLSGDLTLNAATSLDQTNPQCKLLGSNIACGWNGVSLSGSLVPLGRIMNGADGTTFVTNQFTINAAIAGTDQVRPVPIRLGGNPFYFWINGQDLSGIAMTGAGVPSSAVMKFNVNAALGQTARVSAVETTDGTGIVVYGARVGVANSKIYQSSISAALSILESETAISTGINSQSRPTIVQVPNGGVFDTWNGDNGVDVGLLGVFGTSASSTSAPTSSQAPTSTSAPTSSQAPSTTIAPTVSQAPSTTIAPTVSQSPSSSAGPTTSLGPTNAPTSGASSLQPGLINLPYTLIYHAVKMAANAGGLFGKLFG